MYLKFVDIKVIDLQYKEKGTDEEDKRNIIAFCTIICKWGDSMIAMQYTHIYKIFNSGEKNMFLGKKEGQKTGNLFLQVITATKNIDCSVKNKMIT